MTKIGTEMTNYYIRLTGTTWASRHQKGKPFWILLEQDMVGWQ